MTQEKKSSAFMKPVHFTKELEAIIGAGPLPRTEITKKIWAYIKQKQLQDPSNKRNIKPDAALAQVLGSSETIDMFQLTRLIAKQIKEPAAALS